MLNSLTCAMAASETS